MTIVNLTRNSVMASRAAKADTPAARMRGLLDKTSLPAGEALVITNCQSIHMFFMKFALDIVFVDQAHKVIGLCPKIRPFHLSPIFFNAKAAIELPAGTIDLTQTQLGDLLQIS